MKKTVKKWCKEYGFDWYGAGVKGGENYDYKIVYRKLGGSSSVGHFVAIHGSSNKPKLGKKKDGGFLIFPVYSQVIGEKEMSRSKFESVSSWVQTCLSGNITVYSKNESRFMEIPDSTNQTVNKSVFTTP